MHGGLSPDLQSMEQIRRVMRPTDVPDTGACTRCPFASSICLNHSLKACCATYSGPTLTKISPAGQKMIVVFPSRLAPM
jgi:hypothetical protein